jgi:hypothetical protein
MKTKGRFINGMFQPKSFDVDERKKEILKQVFVLVLFTYSVYYLV